jgi:hypothetical protein
MLVEPDYLLDSEVCFSRAWTPFPKGGCGGISPHNCRQGGLGGWWQFLYPPPGGGFGASPRSEILGKIAL